MPHVKFTMMLLKYLKKKEKNLEDPLGINIHWIKDSIQLFIDKWIQNILINVISMNVTLSDMWHVHIPAV